MGRITPEIAAFVHEQRLGFHATVCADGTPNLSPKGTTAVYDSEHLMFAELRSPQTLANLARNPTIEVNMVDPIVRKGWRFKGTAEVRLDPETRERALERYEREGYTVYPERIGAIVLIRVESVRELTSPAYDDGSSEQDVARWWAERYAEHARRWL
jgi:predicted pyridoxine 5'-phosphate oxidase superfamily flavin-nucleotide-binding protein